MLSTRQDAGAAQTVNGRMISFGVDIPVVFLDLDSNPFQRRHNSRPSVVSYLIGYAAAVRYAKEIAGCTVGGVAYPSDRETQAKLTTVALFAQVDNTQTFQWKLADGSFSETLSAAQMIAVAAAVGGYVNSCFAEEAEVVAEIDGGTITTREQIDAAFAA